MFSEFFENKEVVLILFFVEENIFEVELSEEDKVVVEELKVLLS